jgi:protein-tyrosine phosphatase
VTDPISHVNVWLDDDELVVSWRGGSAEMSVFVSDDPDDAGTDVRAPDGPGRAVVRRSSSRQYIHLFDPDDGFVVAAERRLDMQGPSNFRDIGGYPTIDGSQTRWGRVFRSDGLHGLSDSDHDRLRGLGVTMVFDLRSDGEVEQAPDRLPDDITHVHMPMSSDVAQQRSMLERIVDGDLRKFDEDDMSDGYLRMLEGFPDYLAQVIGAVADGERIVFHCTAGKDRTGITAMTLLGLAGVADPYILDDYEISARYREHSADGANWFAERIREAGFDPDDFEPMWGSPRPVMRKTLEGLRDKWGDHATYVRSIGVDDGVAAKAKAALRVDSFD